MKTTAATAATLPVADLAAHNAIAGHDFADLAEDILTAGVVEPLYVVTTETGTARVVDGMRRLAAAVALGLTDVPVTYRPLVSVTALTAHPGNVRRDLRLTAEFTQSISVEGVRTPILVTRAAEGLRVVDGHRRLAAAVAAKLTHVPYVYEERGEAEQVLDMVTTARHRAALTKSEEAAALFEAAALGADTKRIAAAGAVTLAHAKKVKALAKSESVRAATAHRTTGQAATLEDLAILAELETSDPQAAAQALAQMEAEPDGHHMFVIRRARTESKRRQAAETHRAELDARSARIRTVDELRETALRVSRLTGISTLDHATCQGHVWVLEDGASSYEPYCTNPALYGHEVPASASTQGKPTPGERRAIIEGNKDWDVAEELRRDWLTALFGKARRPRPITDRMTQITSTVLVTGSEVISRRASHPATRTRLNEWMGLPWDTYPNTRAAAVAEKPAHAALYAFAAVAAAYEQHTVRTVWRTDGDHAGATIRTDAAQYLTWLVSLGYQPTVIEQAVIDGKPYSSAAAALAADEATGKTVN
ncbi:ParB N-terminal domain-containing protein [Streptomyces sp. NPDC012746]|uniref:ParB/RepB/Spo0J family partition protein n=1 Tax=Streptomyces sp. NPDC012746 TaxID=3364845 RepID=UPI0036BB8CFF